MKPQWNDQIRILENALHQLNDLYPKLPTTFILEDIVISKNDLMASFSEVVGVAQVIANSEDLDPILLAANKSNVNDNCNQILEIMHLLSSSPEGTQAQYLGKLANNISSIHSSLVWLVKPSMAEHYFNSIRNTDLIGKIEANEILYKNLLETSKKIDNFVNQINSSDEQVKTLLSSIQGHEREASNAKTNAESSSSLALTNKETIQELLTKLESGQTRQQELLEKINSLQEQASLVLEGSSKAGLAKSFATRRESLEKNLDSWKNRFFVGIAILISVILLTTVGFLNLPSLIRADGTIDAWSVLARILLTGPAVWFTWFVARQYGHTLRLIEDYAFKEASALAFVGYKREMGEDEEMIKLLRETAIKNFGSPPTRMLSISEPSSPLHELIDKSLQKGNTEKIIEILKALNPNKNT